MFYFLPQNFSSFSRFFFSYVLQTRDEIAFVFFFFLPSWNITQLRTFHPCVRTESTHTRFYPSLCAGLDLVIRRVRVRLCATLYHCVIPLCSHTSLFLSIHISMDIYMYMYSFYIQHGTNQPPLPLRHTSLFLSLCFCKVAWWCLIYVYSSSYVPGTIFHTDAHGIHIVCHFLFIFLFSWPLYYFAILINFTLFTCPQLPFR